VEIGPHDLSLAARPEPAAAAAVDRTNAMPDSDHQVRELVGAAIGHQGGGEAARPERAANVPRLPTGSSSARWTRAEAKRTPFLSSRTAIPDLPIHMLA